MASAPATVTVTYFAALADRTGCRREELDLAVATVGGLRAAVGQRHGADVEALARQSSVLTGDELVRDDEAAIGPVVDLLPPFAGG
ncbi:molybdopterin synthase small subunit MoaD [Gordonia araii NBRC 100433]|uniref:Molybdopterin synthase small subunit MoaD n=1 Tax=Gordonia araii NBRC 100433 TaxID=1073574 RepID=G7H113_9ACTN|nr:MoaD/ThiS family protein [Gordonia araii]NNG96738.1 MoaD/ThiS family protein [Gordonia araii NBRC 100433]GAB09574.1 molybdopterin synthase small subunit MoaD [Gordonia araii NBRC 100433]